MTERPFIFVVNVRSGGLAGAAVHAQLQRTYGDGHVHRIDGCDLAALAARWHGRAAALVAAGGDGTATALLEAAWAAARRAGGEPLPVGILPLGTGNDLARVAGAPLGGPLAARVAWLAAAKPVPIDRWTVRGPDGERAWYNYCSWGVDARIAGRFHALRQQHGWLLRTRLANLAAYAGLGLQEGGSPLGATLATAGGAVELPRWARSLVVASIPSFAGGRSLGPRIAAADGRCDVFVLGGGLALGLGLSGLRRPRCAGAHAGVRVRLDRPLHQQLDGEPRRVPAGEHAIAWAGRVRLLAAG